MSEFSTCGSARCGQRFEGKFDSCPRCGSAMYSSLRMKAMAWTMIGAGVVLFAIILALAWFTLPAMRDPGAEVNGTSFEGGGIGAAIVIGIYALVALFGAIAISAGTYQLRHGRIHGNAKRMILTLATAFFVIGTAAEIAVEFL